MSAPASVRQLDDFGWVDEPSARELEQEGEHAGVEQTGPASTVATASLLPVFENKFLGRARYPKGRQTLQAILDATYALIITDGPTAASQQAIAARAKVTQSAVRHYFPTKDDLLLAFFSTGIERLQALMQNKLAETTGNPRTQLLECAQLQYQRICEVDAVFFFESSAFARRNADFAAMRESWYQSVMLRYQQLIHKMHPDWPVQCCQDTGYQVLTLILGGWITAGGSRFVSLERSPQTLTTALLRGIEQLIDG